MCKFKSDYSQELTINTIMDTFIEDMGIFVLVETLLTTYFNITIRHIKSNTNLNKTNDPLRNYPNITGVQSIIGQSGNYQEYGNNRILT